MHSKMLGLEILWWVIEVISLIALFMSGLKLASNGSKLACL